MDSSQRQTVAVVGLGYVGLPVALLAEEKGYRVIGIDVDEKKVESINRRVSPINDGQVVSRIGGSSLEATTDASRVAEASVVLVCVPTPVSDSHLPDLGPLRSAIQDIAPFLAEGALVVIESTINPGVCEGVVIPLLERITGARCGSSFFVAHCPERINPGDPKWSVESIPRVVGASDQEALQKAMQFYQSILNAEVRPMSTLKEAEAVKVVENAFRDINIAFVNELAVSFSKLGIDVVHVIEGAATKPFAFLPHYPGCGVGGHCIPVDPYYLIEYARTNGDFHHEFLTIARKVNQRMPRFTVDLLLSLLKERGTEGIHVGVFGLSYKPDVDDDRESPSYEIMKHLQSEGISFSVFDPFFSSADHQDRVARSLGFPVQVERSFQEALERSDAVIVATAHSYFQEHFSPEMCLKYGISVVVDGRNVLPKEKFQSAGIAYKGIGR